LLTVSTLYQRIIRWYQLKVILREKPDDFSKKVTKEPVLEKIKTIARDKEGKPRT
jgi:hypothetical protein